MLLTLYTEGFFDSAHFIENHPGKCSTLHGHSWKVSIWIRGEEEQLNDIGILWDFGNIKKITKELDHKNLNQILEKNPTAENLTVFIYNMVKKDHPQLNFKVRVYENALSKTSYCEAGDFTDA